MIAESCEPRYFDVPLGECITNDYFDAFPSTACLATAKTCQDFYDCKGYRLADTTDCPSSLDDDFGACANGVATNCPSFDVGTVSNCAVLGGTCTAYNEDDAGASAAGCKILSSCPNMNTGDQCSSTTQLYSCAQTDTSTIAVGQNCGQSSTCKVKQRRGALLFHRSVVHDAERGVRERQPEFVPRGPPFGQPNAYLQVLGTRPLVRHRR